MLEGLNWEVHYSWKFGLSVSSNTHLEVISFRLVYMEQLQGDWLEKSDTEDVPL